MKYLDKIEIQAKYYGLKREAILKTIRELKVKDDDGDSLSWEEVDKYPVQQESVDYLIDCNLQKLLKENPEVYDFIRQQSIKEH